MGESSVVIAVSSVHRKEALEATDYAINELKAECRLSIPGPSFYTTITRRLNSSVLSFTTNKKRVFPSVKP